jgi:hypothetical protein
MRAYKKLNFFLIILENINLVQVQTKKDKMVNNNIKSVLITDDVNEKCVQILENNDLKVVKNTKLSKEQLLEEIKVIMVYFFSLLF